MRDNRINEILKERGLKVDFTNKPFLDKLGITDWRLRRIINNEVEMSASELLAIATWLNVSTEELIDKDNIVKHLGLS
jgi:transcriptional regulator with XRE-family HTH domain